MRSRLALGGLLIACAAAAAMAAGPSSEKEPPRVEPGAGTAAPSDAIVLFDGRDLSKWRDAKGGPARWTIEGGAAVVNRTGNIFTREEFGDCQLHLEWASPTVVQGEGQGRGNSGVYFQGRYEVQVLDSYNNKTYFNGQAGAVYGIAAPLVNPIRKPGEWNTYDIIFRTPKPGPDGKGVVPGSLTVFFNGVLIQDHVAIGASTVAAAFSGATPKGPLMLQDHGSAVRYRNIWLRAL